MKYTFIAASALAALSFTACKKKDSVNEPNNPAQTTAYLKKITETQNGVSKVFTFTYDGQNRLLNYKTADNSEMTVFSYDANGNLVKVEETEAQFHNVYNYTYTNNKPVSATFKSWSRTNGQDDQLVEDDVLTYTVTGNRVTAMHVEMLQDNDEMDFALTYDANGELSNVQDGSNIYNATFTYGTHKSPMPSVTNWVLDQAGFSLYFYARHELLTAAYDFPGTTFDHTETRTYTFNAAGYPVSSTKDGVVSTFEYQ